MIVDRIPLSYTRCINKCYCTYLLVLLVDICDKHIYKKDTSCLHNATRAVGLSQALAGKYNKMYIRIHNYNHAS